MNNLKKYFGTFVILVCVLTMGVFLGSFLEKDTTKKANGNLYNTLKIAIVNLDEGVTYNEESRNFAKEILENYADNLILTGLQDAQTGIEDGRYAAYMIMPADFSRNVISVNTTPQKSLLKYEICGSLSQTATDKAWQNVMELKENLNDDVGYIYISSILSEFHTGQDNALKLMANDVKDKEVLMAINNLDLVNTLDMREVERLKNDIEDLDIHPDVEKNKEIIAAIDTAYKGYLGETATQLGDVKSESAAVDKNLENIREASTKIENINKEDGSRNYSLTKMLEMLGNHNTVLEEQKGVMQSEVDNLLTAYTEVGVKNYLEIQEKAVDTLSGEFKSKHKSDTTSLLTIAIKQGVENIFYPKEAPPFTIDFNDYPKIKDLIDEEAEKDVEADRKENVNKAVDYIDKSIVAGFLNFDYPKAPLPLTKEVILATIKQRTSEDERLKEALKTYATSLGLDESEVALFDLDKYIEMNGSQPYRMKEEVADVPVDGTLEERMKTAMEVDINTVLTNKTVGLYNGIDVFLTTLHQTNNENTDWGVGLDTIKTSLHAMPELDSKDIDTSIAKVASIRVDDIDKQVTIDLQDLATLQTNQKNTLLHNVEGHVQGSATLQEHLTAYNPLDNIKDREIAGYVTSYDRNNTGTQRKIETKNTEYLDFVSKSYTNANEHIQTMKEDVLKQQKASDEKVTVGLEHAKEIRNETSGSNRTLMNDLITKLPYTRVGTVSNSVVYDFITTPNVAEGRKLETSAGQTTIDYERMIASIAGAVIVVWLILWCISKIKQRHVLVMTEN